MPRGATIPVSEAAKILNVDENAATVEEINAVSGRRGLLSSCVWLTARAQKAFERMYDANSPEKGNSFYLQSKVYRAREAMLAHLKANDNDADLEPPPGSGGTGGSTVADKQ